MKWNEEFVRYHENMHVQQQNILGWANFYGRIIIEYLRYGFYNSYRQQGTLEYNADEYGYNNTFL